MGERASRIALLAMLCAAAPVLAGTGPSSPDDLARRLLAAHNRERDAVGVPRLNWSARLAADARGWAARLAALGRLAHAVDDPADLDPDGENLWAGTRRRYSPEEMVGFWTAERARFRPAPFRAEDASGGAGATGHYTQIVWRATREVGCAIADGGGDEYLVCRYAEGGNVEGERPF